MRSARTAVVCAVVAPLLTIPAGSAEAQPAPSNTQCTRGETRYVTSPEALTSLRQIGVPSSWKLATGRGQTVAVVDSGVDDGNVHFRGGVVRGGRSFVGDSPDVDEQGHGTLVAGVVAGRRVDGSVLRGAAPDARILPVKVLRGRDEANDTDALADGIRWAAEQGVGVMNISVSTGPSDPKLPALKSAVEYAISQDVVLVASAGNGNGEGPVTQVQYPAGFPGVIGVAAADTSGDVDDWSIHGEHVDVSAPGSNILATFYGNGDCLVGLDHPYTSYAAPFVSALAAQLRQKFPDDDAEQIANRILATADRPRSNVRDDQQGWGLIQPVAALSSTSSAGPEAREDDATTESVTGLSADFDRAADPAAERRERLVWWGLAMVGTLAIALVARPLAAAGRRAD